MNLFKSGLEETERVLITGAGGWFGLTLAAMLKQSSNNFKLITKNPRLLRFGEQTAIGEAWDWDEIVKFQPTLVVDCAFVLRDYLNNYSLDTYIAENQKLTSRLLQLVALPSVERVIYLSSGAAISPSDAINHPLEDNPYGYLKRSTELAALRLGEEINKKVYVVRPYSVTGSLVTRPERYAFSNLILQANNGEINIEANHKVRRKFVGIDDLLAVSVASSKKSSGYLDSGGELVELSELANRISTVLNLNPKIVDRKIVENQDDNYFSQDNSWNKTCTTLNFEPATLDEQILRTSLYFSLSPK